MEVDGMWRVGKGEASPRLLHHMAGRGEGLCLDVVSYKGPMHQVMSAGHLPCESGSGWFQAKSKHRDSLWIAV